MKKLLFFLVLPLCTLAQIGTNSPVLNTNFSITGSVAGLPDSTMVFITHPGNKQILATDYAKNGKFKLFGNVETPDVYHLSFIGFKEVKEVFLDKNKLTVAGSSKDLTRLKFTGPGIQNDFELYQTRFDPIKTKLNKLVAKINETAAGASRDTMIAAFEKSKKSVLNLVDVFVKEKPSSLVSPFIIYITSPVSGDINELERRYNLLKPEGKKGFYANEVLRMIEASKVGSVGTIAPDFVQADTANNPIALSSFKGKYVLVDFWASWCGPCRMENPAVVSAYNAFKNKNFTILGVSLDQNRDTWLQAIKVDNLTWSHVSDLKYWQNAAAQLYHITGIPANMLIDPTGKIIARNLRGEQLYSTLQQLLN